MHWTDPFLQYLSGVVHGRQRLSHRQRHQQLLCQFLLTKSDRSTSYHETLTSLQVALGDLKRKHHNLKKKVFTIEIMLRFCFRVVYEIDKKISSLIFRSMNGFYYRVFMLVISPPPYPFSSAADVALFVASRHIIPKPYRTHRLQSFKPRNAHGNANAIQLSAEKNIEIASLSIPSDDVPFLQPVFFCCWQVHAIYSFELQAYRLHRR